MGVFSEEPEARNYELSESFISPCNEITAMKMTTGISSRELQNKGVDNMFQFYRSQILTTDSRILTSILGMTTVKDALGGERHRLTRSIKNKATNARDKSGKCWKKSASSEDGSLI